MANAKSGGGGGGGGGGGKGFGCRNTYYFYATLLAIKILSFIPLGYMNKCVADKLQNANLSDLRHLTPFWLVAAIYVYTNPNNALAINLIRTFACARIVASLGYVCNGIPRCALELAFFLSFAITGYMGWSVLYKYRMAL